MFGILVLTVVQISLSTAADNDNVAFYFESEPRDTWIEQGGTATLSCSTSTAVEMTWVWRLHADIHDNTGVVIGGNSHTLVLDHAATPHLDEKFVTCAADIFGTKLLSRYALVRVSHLGTEFLLEPSDVTTKAEVDHVRLDCKPPTGKPLPYVTWKKNGVLVDAANTFVDPLGGLNILNVKASDAGSYQCVANSLENSATATSSSATLTVTGSVTPSPLAVSHDVSFAKARYKISARKGDSVRVVCGFLGNPTPTLTIRTADSGVLVDSADVEVGPHGDWAVVHNIADVTAFKCEGSNSQGSQTMNIPVELSGTLEVDGGVAVDILEGDDLTLVCSDSVGESEYSWYQNGERLPGEEAKFLQRSNPSRADSGMYQCFATNPETNSREQSSFAVTVAGLEPVPVKVTVNSATYGLVGNKLQLSCVGQGNPIPTVTWYGKDENSEMAIRIEDVTYKKTFTSILALLNIANVSYDDDGSQYLCKGTNTDLYNPAVVYNAEADVTVTVVEAIAPSISLPSTSVATSGSPLTLICSVEGSPPPTIQWFKDGNLLEGEEGEKYVTSGEAGVYGCRATNMLGSEEQWVRVQAQAQFSGGEIFLILLIVAFLALMLIVGGLIFVRRNELERRLQEARAKDELLIEKEKRALTPSCSLPPLSPRPPSGMQVEEGEGGEGAAAATGPAVSEVECQTPRSILTPINQ